MRAGSWRERKRLINAGIALLLVVPFLVGTVFFMQGIQRKSSVQAEYTLRTVAQQNARTISVTLQEKMHNLASIWRSFGGYESAERERKLLLVQGMRDIYSFQRVGYAGRDGAAFNSEGERKDISEEDWFQKSLAGETCIVKRTLDGEGSVILSIPVQEEGDAVSGVLYQVFSLEAFQKLMETQAFDGQAQGCLMEKDGSIVMGTEGVVYASETNVFASLLERGEANRPFVEQIQRDAEMGASGGGRYTVEVGGRICYYSPIRLQGTDSLWYYVSILSEEVMDAYSGEILKSVYRLSGLIAGFLILAGFQLYILERGQMKELKAVAYRDDLTGGDSYFAFRQKFESRRTQTGCFFSFDLKEFKYVNKNYGAEKGSEILREIGRLFAREVRGEELAAHVSDDIFVFFFPGMKIEDAPRKCRELLKKVKALLLDLNVQGAVPVFGVCEVDGALDMERYRSRAMFARKGAKLSGDGFGIYDDSKAEEDSERTLLLSRFDAAIQDGEFEIWYQPKYSLKAAGVCGAEALVRWRTKEGDLIPPGKFIPLLEEKGVIRQLDKYVFREVCRQQKGWLERGLRVLPVSVNLSRKTLLNPHAIREYREILAEAGLDAEWVWIEITEDSVDGNILSGIHALRGEGFHILMDDFGRESSNIANLREDCFEGVKFDKSLIDLIGNERDEILLSHTMNMMQEIGLVVTAEGVETQEQVDFLQNLGCDKIQGYFFYRPIRREEYERMLTPPEA